MALDHFLITNFPTPIVGGVKGALIVTALDASGNVQAGYTGTVHFTSSDPAAVLPADYTFTGGDAGVHTFFGVLNTPGTQSFTVQDTVGLQLGDLLSISVLASPLGWGLDPFGITPYGSTEIGVGVHVVSAVAISTHEVRIILSEPPLATSAVVPGDALNPATWLIQRLDTGFVFHAVEVEQFSPTSFGVMTLEPFAPSNVLHQISSTTLLDTGGHVLVAPRQANFAGLVDFNTISNTARLAQRKVTSTDFANTPVSGTASTLIGGTMIVDGSGDYKTVSGPALTRKLMLRRLTTKPSEFFHLPNYGVGLRVKEALPTTDLTKLKALAEQQILQEPEVASVNVSMLLDPSTNELLLTADGVDKATGEPVSVTVPATLAL
jgi:hypothetical protein